MIYCSRLITKMDILKPLFYVLIDVSAQTFCLKKDYFGLRILIIIILITL